MNKPVTIIRPFGASCSITITTKKKPPMTNLRQAIEAFPGNVEELLGLTHYANAALVQGKVTLFPEGNREWRMLVVDMKKNAALVQLQAQVIDELVGALEQAALELECSGQMFDHPSIASIKKNIELAEMLKGRVG